MEQERRAQQQVNREEQDRQAQQLAQQQANREQVRALMRLLVPEGRPTGDQILWAIRIALAVSSVLLVVLLILYVIGLLFGFTLWNLLKVLAIPITVGAAVPLLNWLQKKRELDVEHQRAQDEALQAYLDQMSQLLTDKDRPLHRAQLHDRLSTVARARTLTVLARLEGKRKGSVLQFLYESELISKDRVVLELKEADLNEADLRGANLPGAFLRGAPLRKATLSGVDLSGATLTEAELPEANLQGANLSKAELSGVNLSGADLSYTNLSEATLSYTKLRGADLTEAELSGATLTEANLHNAKGVTTEQLNSCESLEGATMPNGRNYEDWLQAGTPI